MTSVLQYRDPIAYRSNDFMSTPNYASSHMAGLKKTPPYEDHSSGSESKRQQTPGAKRRPSRAGTRSVTTLTAAQLERKRANDREAQRAIRQRTKDHIESLERQIRDLTAQRDTNSSTKLIELMRRNEELEQENALLRTRLSHAVAALGVPDQSGGMSDDVRFHQKHRSNVPLLNYSGFLSLLFGLAGRTRAGSYRCYTLSFCACHTSYRPVSSPPSASCSTSNMRSAHHPICDSADEFVLQEM
jgi:regulator of replication initiation timing